MRNKRETYTATVEGFGKRPHFKFRHLKETTIILTDIRTTNQLSRNRYTFLYGKRFLRAHVRPGDAVRFNARRDRFGGFKNPTQIVKVEKGITPPTMEG